MVRGGRLAVYGAVSTALAVWTVLNAFRQRSNFYAAAVYLSKSNACMMASPLSLSPHDPTRRVLTTCARQILWNQGIFQTVLFGKLLQAVFLGELRLIEVEVSILSQLHLGGASELIRGYPAQRLQERGWFAVTETLLALTIFKDDFESTFVVLFVGLLFLKVFHWLASDRIEMVRALLTGCGPA